MIIRTIVSKVLRLFTRHGHDALPTETFQVLARAAQLARQSGDDQVKPDHIIAAMQPETVMPLPEAHPRSLPLSDEAMRRLRNAIESAGGRRETTLGHLRANFTRV